MEYHDCISRNTSHNMLKDCASCNGFHRVGEFNKQIVYAKQPKWEDEDTTSLLKWDVDPFLQDGAPSR